MIRLSDVIYAINPNANFVIRANDIDRITWTDGTTPIPKADIEAQFPIVELDNAMQNLRAKRNRLLQDTDFHALSDNTMSADMTTYRQELRDITNGITTVAQANAVVFPNQTII